MGFSLTVGGYEFENPPEQYRKRISVGNTEQRVHKRTSSDFYQSDSQDLTLEVEGTLAIDPALGGTDDLDEMARLQQIGIDGGEVTVDFDPFFSGDAVILDGPLEQGSSEARYRFTFSPNTDETDPEEYPAQEIRNTGNTFELGDTVLGFDPNSVQQNYNRQIESVDRLAGITRSVDNDGLVPRVNVEGIVSGEGQAELWEKARNNVMAFLSAEFQNGWCLIDELEVESMQQAPDYLEGMFQYRLATFIVADPDSGIGQVSSRIDRDVARRETYVSNCPDDGSFERLGDDSDEYPYALDYRISSGTGQLNDEYVQWDRSVGTLDQNSTNFLFVVDADGSGYGQVERNTSGFPANSVPLWEIETLDSEISQIQDHRACLIGERRQTADGDLNFSDSLRVRDRRIDFFRSLSFDDDLAVGDAKIRWLGIARFDDQPSVDDGKIGFLGIRTLGDETFWVDDGGTATEPGDPELITDLDLNEQTVKATVFEDTDGDGTADNQQQITLPDGQSEHTLSDLDGSGDDYWIRFDLDGDGSDSPEVHSSLVDPSGDGDKPNQNPNTIWEIFGAKYDTSGNEYEGGGVISRYGG